MRPYPRCLSRVVSALLQDLGTPRALTVHLLIENGEWDQLVKLRVDPALYSTADAYYRDAVATELLRKCADIPSTIDREKVALEGFWQTEKACHATNLRLYPFLHNGPYLDPADARIGDFLVDVRQWIGGVLKSLPRDLAGRHGPGATFYDRGRATTVPDKMQSRPTVTSSARALLPLWETTAWARGLMSDWPNRSDPETIRGNRFTTVPKDAEKDRGIGVEPSLNVFYQLSVGKYMRERLHRVGIDLDEGQAVHRQVACEASKTGRYATLDLSSASDTIARNLVALLLPSEWYDLLATLRSPLTRVGDKWVYLEKFSSMGNGFTFELETLIFLGLAVKTAEKLGCPCRPGVDIWVYGDDIIIPVEVYDAFKSVLQWCGFTLNKRKSFAAGPFRESCGGDYFHGEVVRPHYLKEYPNDPASWISLANGLRRVAIALSGNGSSGGPVQRAWFRVLDNIPSDIRRCRGPECLGDLLIHDESEKWSFKVRNQIRYFKTWSPVKAPRWTLKEGPWSPEIQLASALYGVPSEGPIHRGPVTGWRFRRVPYS